MIFALGLTEVQKLVLCSIVCSVYILHTLFKYLENPQAYAQLFADFSLTFNAIQPQSYLTSSKVGCGGRWLLPKRIKNSNLATNILNILLTLRPDSLQLYGRVRTGVGKPSAVQRYASLLNEEG